MQNKNEPIVAIATATGQGAIGVVRISDPHETRVQDIIRAILGKPIKVRIATLSVFVDERGAAIDQGIALYFPAPHSYTGEHILELQAHGGQAVLQMLQARCVELGARLARPGEFTERAFLNGKLDLAQAESVADIITASTAQAVRSAQQSLSGKFSERVHHIVEALIECRMWLEGSIDFSDEGIDFIAQVNLPERLSTIQERIQSLFEKAKQGQLLRDGVTVAIIGPPNAGKSSLLNALAGEELAIVTPHAGTTRDIVRTTIAIQGVPFHILDTAGLRETNDPVEKIGIERTINAASTADLIIMVMDARGEDDIMRYPAESGDPEKVSSPVSLIVKNKVDLINTPPGLHENACWISAKTGAGLSELRQKMLETIGWNGKNENIFSARTRHLAALAEAHQQITQTVHILEQNELAAEHLRLAQNSLNSITGEFSADDLLGEIFGNFCIGK